MLCEVMSFEEFENDYQGDHLGYVYESILAIVNCNVAPNKFVSTLVSVHLTYGLGGHFKNYKMATSGTERVYQF